MGNSDSKLVFKQGIFKLSEVNAIPASDPYWRGVSGLHPLNLLQLTIRSSGSCLNRAKMSSVSSPQ